MHTNITNEDETDRDWDTDQARTTDQALDPDVTDAGHVMNRFYLATLTERVVGFMERYNWSLYA